MAEQKRKQNLQNVIALYMALGLILAGLLGYFVIRTFIAQGRTDAQKVKANNQEIQALEKLGDDTEVLRANYEAIKSKREKVLALLPSTVEEEYLVSTLGELAAQNGVVLGGFAPQNTLIADENAPVPAAGEAYAATVTVSGTFEGVSGFLEAMENGARFVDVMAIQILGDQNPNRNAVSAKIQFNAYYLPAGGESL